MCYIFETLTIKANIPVIIMTYTVFRKKHPLTFYFKCPIIVDSDNVEIRYSLRPMTSL